MVIYIVRRDSNQILGCFTSLARAKARVDKEIDDLHKKMPFDKIMQEKGGFRTKLYSVLGMRKGVSSAYPNSLYPSYTVWIQQHHLTISPLEMLAGEAE